MALGIGKNRLSEYETGSGAPAWMRYALLGYASVQLQIPADELLWLLPPSSTPSRGRARVRTSTSQGS